MFGYSVLLSVFMYYEPLTKNCGICLQTKLEERQAALDKLECEARKANIKVEELQCEMESMDFEKSSLMLLFQELSRNDSVAYSEDNITSFQKFEHLSHKVISILSLVSSEVQANFFSFLLFHLSLVIL